MLKRAFWDQWQELVTKSRTYQEGEKNVESYRKMSDEVIHLKRKRLLPWEKCQAYIGLSPAFMMMKHFVEQLYMYHEVEKVSIRAG